MDALRRFGINVSQDEADDLFNITDDNSDDLINHTEFKNILYDAVPPSSVPLGGNYLEVVKQYSCLVINVHRIYFKCSTPTNATTLS